MTSISFPEVRALFQEPLLDLVHRAAAVHREHHDPSAVQCSRLLSIKTGGCPEDCGYCSQSAHHHAKLDPEQLLDVESVRREAERAKDEGADRFCMGAAWRGPRDGAEFEKVLAMVREVKALGLEACATLGRLEPHQAQALAEAGLDYYNHNLDTGRSHYEEIVSTHDYDDRLATLGRAREAGMKLCCGGILGMGEGREVRAELVHELASLDPRPESVPINALVPIAGTPLEDQEPIDWSEVVRTVAAARIAMPETTLRLSAGRAELGEAAQALCFLAGANSIFLGDRLLTTPNADTGSDAALFAKLGVRPKEGRDVAR